MNRSSKRTTAHTVEAKLTSQTVTTSPFPNGRLSCEVRVNCST